MQILQLLWNRGRKKKTIKIHCINLIQLFQFSLYQPNFDPCSSKNESFPQCNFTVQRKFGNENFSHRNNKNYYSFHCYVKRVREVDHLKYITVFDVYHF